MTSEAMSLLQGLEFQGPIGPKILVFYISVDILLNASDLEVMNLCKKHKITICIRGREGAAF